MKTIEERKSILENDISRHVSHGWRILSRSETSCKLEKDWKPNSSILDFFVLGILYPIAGVAKIWFNFSIQGIYSDLQGLIPYQISWLLLVLMCVKPLCNKNLWKSFNPIFFREWAIRQIQGISDKPTLEFGSLTIDLANHIVRKNNKILKLTSTEFSLLGLLAKNEGRVLTHQYILKEVWGMGYIEQTQYLRVFIAQLRKKVEDDPAKPKLLNTESGIGYRFGS